MSGHPIAQLAHAEYLTAKPDETVWFFKDLLGMQESHREGRSVYLCGRQDTYHHSLSVTESDEAGLGHAAWRTSSPEPQRRPLHGVPVRRIDHLNLMAADQVATRKLFCETPPTFFAHGTPSVEMGEGSQTDGFKHDQPSAVPIS